MTTVIPSSSTSPLPEPGGDWTYDPKVLGQASRVRTEISRNSTTRVGLQVVVNGVNVDPDSIMATVFQKTDFSPGTSQFGNPTEISPADMAHESAGVFSFVIDPTITSQLSQVTIWWQYSINSITYQYWDFYQILEYMPTYEALTDPERDVVKLVSMMFDDLYDSVEGGPHLASQFQTHFGFERIAQCMGFALDKINMTSQPYTNYTLGSQGKVFPTTHMSILRMGTYMEVVRHLIRSYVEMPTMQGSPGVAMFDRSNYTSRWQSILNSEVEDYKSAVRSFKRSLMNLGGGALIVSGGIYATMPNVRAGMYSAQVRGGRNLYPTTVVRTMPSPAG